MRLTVSFRAVAATVLVAAAVVLTPQAPASAAGCAGVAGVTVVVDPNQLGGSVSAGCDPVVESGEVARKSFADAGYTLQDAQGAGMTGFVCKVSGRPADGDCTQTDAYWSLWWSDGKTGTWVYASRGVDGLRVPNGGYVAFSWHQGGGRAAPPTVRPDPRTAPAPTPTTGSGSGSGKGDKNGKNDGKRGDQGGEAGGATGAGSAQPSASPSLSPSASPSASASASATPTTTPSDSASATTDAPVPTDPGTGDLPSIDEITDGPPEADASGGADDDGGFPVWAGVGLAVLVLGAAGAVPVLRRRQG